MYLVCMYTTLFTGMNKEILEKIIETEEFQRLYRIRQLGGVGEVFKDANHTRYEHSVE